MNVMDVDRRIEAAGMPRVIRCPYCKEATETIIYEDTVLVRFPLRCSRCKREYRINVLKFQMSMADEPGV